MPVRLGPKIISSLYDQFLSSDSSVFNFLQAIKLTLLDHFARVETAFIGLADDQHDERLERLCKEKKLKLERVQEAIAENRDLTRNIRPFILKCILATGKFFKLPKFMRITELEVFIDLCDETCSLRKKKKRKLERSNTKSSHDLQRQDSSNEALSMSNMVSLSFSLPTPSR